MESNYNTTNLTETLNFAIEKLTNYIESTRPNDLTFINEYNFISFLR